MHHSMTFITALLMLATLGVAATQSQTATPPAQRSQQEQQNQQPTPQATLDDPVLVNGAWNVPGAPVDSQTVPAKFSARNAALDKLPIMATPLWLTDEQRKKIAATLRTGNAPVATIDTPFAKELPLNVEMLELPDVLKGEIPDVNKLKYVRAGDRILLVDPPNRVVVGEIKN